MAVFSDPVLSAAAPEELGALVWAVVSAFSDSEDAAVEVAFVADPEELPQAISRVTVQVAVSSSGKYLFFFIFYPPLKKFIS